jgi:DNA adenine methylase
VERRGLRPFLKWVGGKRQLLPALRRHYPPAIGRYFEPFVGSGAVFFDLLNRGALRDAAAILSDDNADLIGCYRRLAHSADEVIVRLETIAADHAGGGRECYLRVRDSFFNPLRAAWHQSGADVDTYSAELTAMLIYLNRTGYNGLFRLNASGEFNVPPGRYERPRIVDRWLLEAASAALSAPNVEIVRAGFDRVLGEASAGDFVYFDPPYAPLSPTANFRGYTGRGFSDLDQQRLQSVAIALAARGVHVTLSNSTAPAVTRLYENNAAAAAAGLQTWRVPARRSINSRATGRGHIEELIVSNVIPADVRSALMPPQRAVS